MKNILRTLMFAFLLVALGACENDTDPVAVSNDAPTLLTPTSGTDYVLTEATQNNVLTTLVWDQSNYGLGAVPNYTVEIAETGTNFANPIKGGVSTERFLTWTVGQLNQVLIDQNVVNETPRFEPFTKYALDVRVKATLGTAENAMVSYSNVVTLNVTPFKAVVVALPKLYFVGAPQAYYNVAAWTPEVAIPMRYIGTGTTKVFEAYVKVNPGDGFKFVGGLNWNEGNYGTVGGAQNGTLENSGGSSDIKVAETDGPGLYYVQVDIDNLTYKAVKMNWGIIGDATGSWDNETAMTYDFANNKFVITTTLTAGQLKFRASNASKAIFGSGELWKFNVGDPVSDTDPNTAWDTNAPNFSVSAGPHYIELSIGLDGIATVTGV